MKGESGLSGFSAIQLSSGLFAGFERPLAWRLVGSGVKAGRDIAAHRWKYEDSLDLPYRGQFLDGLN